jgi:hypothetical protein
VSKIALIVGSVRRDHQGIKVARWMKEKLQTRTHTIYFIDPLELNLPLLDRMYKEMVDPSEISRLTGFVKGGVSPLGGKRSYPVYMDQSTMQHPSIYVSAGVRGLAIAIAPSDLAQVTRATVVDLLE